VQERVLEGHRKVLGPQHVETLAALGNLAVTMRALGAASEARLGRGVRAAGGAAGGSDAKTIE